LEAVKTKKKKEGRKEVDLAVRAVSLLSLTTTHGGAMW
jgi:hypothetical protein